MERGGHKVLGVRRRVDDVPRLAAAAPEGPVVDRERRQTRRGELRTPLSPKRARDGNSPAPKAKASRTACYQPARAKENDLPALPSFSECDSDECAHSESDSDESDSDE